MRHINLVIATTFLIICFQTSWGQRDVKKDKINQAEFAAIYFQGQPMNREGGIVDFKQLYIIIKYPCIRKVLELNHYKIIPPDPLNNHPKARKISLCDTWKIDYQKSTMSILKYVNNINTSDGSSKVIDGSKRDEGGKFNPNEVEKYSALKIGLFGPPLTNKNVFRLDSNTLVIKLENAHLAEGAYISAVILGASIAETIISNTTESYWTKEIWDSKHIRESSLEQIFSEKEVQPFTLTNLAPLEDENEHISIDTNYVDLERTVLRKISDHIQFRDTIYSPHPVNQDELTAKKQQLEKELAANVSDLDTVKAALQKQSKNLEFQRMKRFLLKQISKNKASLNNLPKTMQREQETDYYLRSDSKNAWVIRLAHSIDISDSIIIENWRKISDNNNFNAFFHIRIDTILYQYLNDNHWYGLSPADYDKSGNKIYFFNNPSKIYNLIIGLTCIAKNNQNEFSRRCELTVFVGNNVYGLKSPDQAGIETVQNDLWFRLIRYTKDGKILPDITGKIKK